MIYPKRKLVIFVFFGSLWCSTQASPAPLPQWQVLEFEQKAFLATARSTIEIKQHPKLPQQWLLNTASSVSNAFASNFERIKMTLDAGDFSLRTRYRFSRGSDERVRDYAYLPDHIERERRDPDTDDSKLRPPQWPVSSTVKIAYPATGDLPITDAYALLPLAGQLQASTAATRDIVVQTDFNFYRVRLARAADTTVDVNYRIAGAQRISGKRAARAVTLTVEPLGTLADKPDFDLLGLDSPLTILFDQASGAPVQIRGTAPLLGSTTINLKKVTLRTTAP